MDFKYNDGGRGTRNENNDCVARAFTIVVPHCNYGLARALVSPLKVDAGVNVYDTEFMQLMERMGFVYYAAPSNVGKLSDIPQTGTYMAHTPNHVTAVVDGVVNDIYDARKETLKGYWLPKSAKGYQVFKGETKLNRWPLNFSDALKMVSNYSHTYDRSTLLTIKPVI